MPDAAETAIQAADAEAKKAQDEISKILLRRQQQQQPASDADMTPRSTEWVEHPEGGWLMNSKELQYVREKYSSFFPHRKYPDEN